jgi:hypothetical protein
MRYSRAALDREPFRATFDLHEVMVVEETNQGTCGEVEGAFVCWG